MSNQQIFYGRIEEQIENKNHKQNNFIDFQNKLLDLVSEQIDHLLDIQTDNTSYLYDERKQNNHHVSGVHITSQKIVKK